MTITEKLTEDMKASMKAGQTQRTATLRLLRGALKNDEIASGQTVSDDKALIVLRKEAKQRQDSIEAYQKAGRSDLVTQESAELEVIQEYLPQPLSEAELGQIVGEVIAQMGAEGPAQMGAVIGGVMQRVGVRADGGTVARLVREKLTA